MPELHRTRLLILGAGPAGYTAAIYAARAGLQPLVVAGMQPGGQLTITTDVENFPGFAAPVQGPWLMEQMREQAEHVGASIQYDLITSVDLSRRPFRAVGDSGDTYEAEAVVIATGAQARWLGIPGEKELSGFGVSACATCDGFFYRGKDVAVIGGGNSAVEEALYLSNLAKSVTLIHRRDTLRAERILQKRLLAKTNVTVRWNTLTEEVLAQTGGRTPVARGLLLRDAITGERSELAVDGVFVAIGHSPATSLFTGQLAMDAEGYLVTEPDSTRTSVEGVFAAGDVQDRVFRQAVTAAGTGCMAALEAEKFLAVSEDQSQAQAA
ncbi:thioredoxin-disulfide reductase [Roseomonas marmotae]|uniref:Thioredoxin reductase n=1 Tax=Roseomonas marmotae TaxID=2768161 RepID=A0ABS3KBJ4_9PROT|nr:thioredoxin-disulfide reductase [Roseomonas marmotae]MBO1074848.1 thioredoxin-disulfide reductase [Roseomonas marmotae]QTI80647.1 thioredoxin-disulfide reductase [Roseomonas marmotae]